MKKINIETSRNLQVVRALRGNRGPKQEKHDLLCSQDDLKKFFDGAPDGIFGDEGAVKIIHLLEEINLNAAV